MSGLDRSTINNIKDYLPYLDYKEQSLFLYQLEISQLKRNADRPAIVYLPERATENARIFMSAFRKYFPGFMPFYALKSCYIPEIVHAIRDEGFCIEVMSEYEMKIAELCGFTPESFSLNGVGRTEKFHAASINSSLHINYLDSVDDIKALADMAKKKDCKLNVGLRVNPPNVDDSLYIRESNKLGLDWQGGYFLQALEEIKKHKNLHLKAILCHQFYHLTDIEKFKALLRQYVDVVCALYEERGQSFEIIDIGGGFETRFLMEMAGVEIQDFAEAAFGELSRIPYEFYLQAQPGRYLTADTAISLTSVTAAKEMSRNTWLITDIGSNILVPVPGISYYPLPTNLMQDSEWQAYEVGDGTCAPSSICRQAMLPVQKQGDLLVLLNCGAYTSVFAQIWAFSLPDILILTSAAKSPQRRFSYPEYKAMVKSFYGYDIE